MRYLLALLAAQREKNPQIVDLNRSYLNVNATLLVSSSLVGMVAKILGTKTGQTTLGYFFIFDLFSLFFLFLLIPRQF